MNHEYLFRESGQSGMDQLKIGGSGAETPEKIKYLIYITMSICQGRTKSGGRRNSGRRRR